MILIVFLIIPLLAAGLSLLSNRATFAKVITLLSSVIMLMLSGWIAIKIVESPNHLIVAVPHWISLDSLSVIFVLLVSSINVTSSLFAMGYMEFSTTSKVRQYHLNYNLFVFSMLIIPFIQEPNLVWIAVELTTLFSVLLVGFENTHEALEAAWKYVVLTVMGAAIALLGFLVLYWSAKQAGITQYTWDGLIQIAPKISPTLFKVAFVFIFVGLGVKIGWVPLHTWLPDAYSQTPTPVCSLLAGVDTSIVLYVILRLLPIVSISNCMSIYSWMIIFGLISVGVSAFLLLGVKDYKRLFAFSTVEHMGIILVALGIGGIDANRAAILQIVGHSFTKSFCFLAAGSVLYLIGTREISLVRGLLKRSSVSGLSMLIGGLAIAGAPPFVLFLSEFSILKAGLAQHRYVTISLLGLFIVIAFFAIMKHINLMVFSSERRKENSENRGNEDDGDIDSNIDNNINSDINIKALDSEDINADALSEPVFARETMPMICKLALIVAAIPVIAFGVYIPNVLYKLITLAAPIIGQ